MIEERKPTIITVKYCPYSQVTYLLFDNQKIWHGTSFYSSGKYCILYEVYTALVNSLSDKKYEIIESNDNLSKFSIKN